MKMTAPRLSVAALRLSGPRATPNRLYSLGDGRTHRASVTLSLPAAGPDVVAEAGCPQA